ncbi:helix-turn-helix domain-containing protein [Vibrio vulnificus]|nr:helix-turn-helix domain-containing protein [Vibrio vulnificus]
MNESLNCGPCKVIEDSEELVFQQRVGSNVTDIRKMNGVTLKEFSSKSDLSISDIKALERGDLNLTINQLSKIAKALSVSESFLCERRSTGTRLDVINYLFESVREYQSIAYEYGVSDIFQDNGGKLLQVLLVTGLENLKGREGNDAIDRFGNEYELKSLNAALGIKGFSTHHHLNEKIIEKYEKVSWVFAVYDGIELSEIWLVRPDELKEFYGKWRLQLQGTESLNNPKIPLKFVRRNGIKVFERTHLGRLDERDICQFLGID